MKILVDANIFTRKEKSGVDYYTLGLILAAARLIPDDQFVLAHFGKGKISIPQDIHNIRIKRIWWLPGKMYGIYRHYFNFLPLELFMPVHADVMFFPDFSCPVTIQKVPKVTVIHDLVYLLQPEYVPEGHQKFLKSIIGQALRQATAIVVNSDSTASDLVKAYGYRQELTSIIPPAVDTKLYKPATPQEINKVKQKYNIQGEYVLFLSTLEPRKNPANLMRAYRELPQELQSKYQLVMAGKKGWLDKEIEEVMAGLGDRVVRTGRIETDEKAALYTGARAFAYPSVYEGYGLPVLEAMACGTPVITSNTSSMPEAADGAALLVDPSSVEDIKSALEKILTNDKLASELSTAGSSRVKRATWKESGKKLANLLKRLAKS